MLVKSESGNSSHWLECGELYFIKMNIASLPHDVLFKVLCELEMKDICNFRIVSTGFAAIANSPNFWRMKSILDFRLFTEGLILDYYWMFIFSDVMKMSAQNPDIDWKDEYFTMYSFWVCVRENRLILRDEDTDIGLSGFFFNFELV